MFTISRKLSLGTLDQLSDTLEKAIAVALGAPDITVVTITNLDTGEQVVGIEIRELAERLSARNA